MTATEQLAALARIDALLRDHGIEYWLFGGWAVDFHAGSVTRAHHDVDLAVWLTDAPRIAALLAADGWEHAPEAGEDGYTAYERGGVRLELAFLARDQGGEDGAVWTPLREGRAGWPDGAFGGDVAELRGVRARVMSRRALIADKSEPRDDPAVAAKDRADVETLSARPPMDEGAAAPDGQAVDAPDRTVRLRDGRTLGYAEYRQASGDALFYFGASRLEARLLAPPAARAGVRLIGLDRPGMGLSQFQPGRRLLDWPSDVVELADQLGIARFAVVGVSAGGPHALACARAVPDRLIGCGIVSGVGPLVVRFYQRVPWLLRPMMWVIGRFFRTDEQARKSLTRFTRGWPESDRETLRVPGVGDIWAASLVEAFRQGSRGMSNDTALVEGRPWGFALEDIALPRLFLWHGGLDQDVPIAMGRAVAERLPGCTATYYPDEGHLSVIVNHRGEIVRALTS